MKTNDQKEKFVMLRAEGLSYSKIAEELKISKSTCTAWEKDLSEQIRRAKEERLADLYTLYRVGKEAHIKKLGETIERIDEALAQKDLTEIPADKLLRLKLEYEDKLQEQRRDTESTEDTFTVLDTSGKLTAVIGLYRRIREGTVTAQQAKAELETLNAIIKAKDEDREAPFWEDFHRSFNDIGQ